MSLQQVWEIFDKELPFIDGILARSGVPISRRPLDSSMFFVEECIVEVQGMTKLDFMQGWWFGDILRHARDWYIARYGTELVDAKDNMATSMIVFFHTPFIVRIPLTVSKRNRETNLIELTFPLQVLSSERPTDWLVNPPNLGTLSPDDRMALEHHVRQVADLVRRLDVSLTTANHDGPVTEALASGSKASLEKGVEDVCSMREERCSIAVWEFAFAAEKALKAYLISKGWTLVKTHDLPSLLTEAIKRGLVADTTLLEPFPETNKIIASRYGEGPHYDSAILHKMYFAALSIAAHCAANLPHRIQASGEGATFFLKPFPWATSDRAPDR